MQACVCLRTAQFTFPTFRTGGLAFPWGVVVFLCRGITFMYGAYSRHESGALNAHTYINDAKPKIKKTTLPHPTLVLVLLALQLTDVPTIQHTNPRSDISRKTQPHQVRHHQVRSNRVPPRPQRRQRPNVRRQSHNINQGQSRLSKPEE